MGQGGLPGRLTARRSHGIAGADRRRWNAAGAQASHGLGVFVRSGRACYPSPVKDKKK